MDHLPTAPNPIWVARVPYLSRQEYDCLEFSSYPARMGWDKERLLRGDLTEHPAEDTAAFLQTWLYFGVMHETLRVSLRREEFTVLDDSGYALVSTKNLPSLINSAQKNLRLTARVTSLAGFWSLLPKVSACLEEVARFLRHHVWNRGHVPPLNRISQDALPDEILLSILVLIETIDATYSHFTNPNKSAWLPYTPDVEYQSTARGLSPLLLEKLKDNGHCWNDIDRLLRSCNNSALYYASTLPRSPQKVDHNRCSMQSCIANNIDENSYLTKHVPGCVGGCLFKGPEPEKLKAILRQGLIPVINITNTPEFNDIEVEVTSVTKRSIANPFVAISHVWSDGLGNPHQNQLPVCQLRRLQRLADSSYNAKHISSPSTYFHTAVTRQVPYNGWAHKFHGIKPSEYAYKKVVGSRRQISFWMDTLCVPLDREARSLAISRLRDVYLNANSVLVLDAELEVLTAQMSDRELLVRMHTSGWMRRMWTLQEGALGAWNLQIQLSDGTFGVGGSAARLWSKWWSQSFVTDAVDEHVANFFDEFAHLKKAFDKPRKLSDFDVPGQSNALEKALLAYSGRSTSKPKDSYICLAYMLAMKAEVVREISNLPEEDRTKRVLQEIPLLPPSMIFSPGRKLQEKGYRWATNPLWDTELYRRNMSAGNNHSPFDPSLGLQVWFPGFIISATWVIDPVAPHFYFIDETSNRSGGHSSSHTSISENTTRQIHPPFFKKS